MILNMYAKTLSFVHNEKDHGIAYRNIDFSDDTKYNMAISVYGENDTVQLIDFQQRTLK